MGAASEEQILFHGHPSWRAIIDVYLKGWLIALVIAVVVGAVTDVANGAIDVGLVVLAVVVSFAIVLLVGFVIRKRTLYTITTQRLTIRKGLLSRDVQETRLDRIQNVNTRQSFLQRILAVGTVDFDTAAGAEYNFAFHGLAHPERVVRTVDRALREMPHPRV
jgi:uncharacterized membrane protein YdbT with pleckstrin-like domain